MNPKCHLKRIASNRRARQNVSASSSCSNVSIRPAKRTSRRFDLASKSMAQDKLTSSHVNCKDYNFSSISTKILKYLPIAMFKFLSFASIKRHPSSIPAVRTDGDFKFHSGRNHNGSEGQGVRANRSHHYSRHRGVNHRSAGSYSISRWPRGGRYNEAIALNYKKVNFWSTFKTFLGPIFISWNLPEVMSFPSK